MQLNYHHLFYFYITAKEGGVINASKRLHVTAQTVSGQVSKLEHYLGYPLFDRVGKKLLLNQRGKVAFNYAEQIFQTGNQLVQALSNNFDTLAREYVVGITDAIPKVLAYDFIHKSMRSAGNSRFIFKEASFDTLVAEMSINKVDLVLADRGLATGSQIKAFSQELGASSLSFFAPEPIAIQLKGTFPNNLNGQPLLLPSDRSGIRLSLVSWLEAEQVFPQFVAEFDDSALLKLFGSEGFGIFCAPSCISSHVETQYGVVCIGDTPDLSERYYAISNGQIPSNTPLSRMIIDAKKVLNYNV